MGWLLPLHLDGHGNRWGLVVGITITVCIVLRLFGVVRIFSFFVGHRPIHSNRGLVKQPINVEETCSVRVIFSFQ
jgi:hypothetical protein